MLIIKVYSSTQDAIWLTVSINEGGKLVSGKNETKVPKSHSNVFVLKDLTVVKMCT